MENVTLREIAFSSPLSTILTTITWSIMGVVLYFGPKTLRHIINPRMGWISVILMFFVLVILSWLLFGFQIKGFSHSGLKSLLMSTHFQCDSSIPTYLISEQSSLYCAYVNGFTNGFVICVFAWFCLLFIEYIRFNLALRASFSWLSGYDEETVQFALQETQKETLKVCMVLFPLIMVVSLLVSIAQIKIKRSRHNFLLTELQRLGLTKEDAVKTLIDKEDFQN